MKKPISKEELMRYLDGEMRSDEYDEFNEQLESSTELQRELAIFRSLRADVQDLKFYPVNYQRSVWDQVNAKVTKRVGWISLIVGWTILTAYGTYAFFTDFEVDSWEKWGAGLLWAGILALLASVIWERYKESRNDPYKDVQR
jgi:hypothetical protein